MERKELVRKDTVFVVLGMSYMMTKDANGKVLVTPLSQRDSHVCQSHEDAVAFFHRDLYNRMRRNGDIDQSVEINEFHENFGKYVHVVEEGNDPPFGEEFGFVHHPMRDSVERYEGYDTTEEYPSYYYDCTIMERSVYGVSNDGADAARMLREDEVAAIMDGQRKCQDCIDHVNSMFDGGDDEDDLSRILSVMGGEENADEH